MLANDVILRLVEMLMAEKDKNIQLQLAQFQQMQVQGNVSNKD